MTRAAMTAHLVHLTFDDGPDRQWTPRVLDALAAAQASATFFVIGRQAQRAPELLRRMLAEGHEVGNHTFSHRHPWTLSRAAARAEVLDGAAVLADLLGQAPRFFRPPHGRTRPCMTAAARAAGQRLVLWHRSAIDWGPFGSAARILARLRATRRGEIVLMHDGRNRHNRPAELLRVLPDFLRELHRRGLRAAPLDSDA